MKSSLEALLTVSLLALVTLAAACSGGGGGDDDDDDDVLPTPARPGFVIMRLDTRLSIAVADGSDLVDVPQSSDGIDVVGYGAGDRIVYSVRLSATTSALFAVNTDGSDNTLLASDVSEVLVWADASHLVVHKGPGPAFQFPPSRDIHLLGVDGTDIPLAASVEDDEFGGISGSTLVLVRGDSLAQNEDLIARPVLVGGAETPLTSDGGVKQFEGFTASGRVVFKTGGTIDVFSVPLAGGTPAILANGPNPENVAAILGERVVIEEEVPTMGGSQADVYAIDSDGTNGIALSATADFPDNLVGITDAGIGLVLRQTSFEPMNFTFDLVAVPLDGGPEVVLSEITHGGLLTVDGETVAFSKGSVEGGPVDIFAVESDGSGLRTLADDPADDVYLALANGHILFRSGTPEKVWSVSLDGGTPEMLRGDASGETFNVALGPMTVMTITGAGGKTDLVAARTSGGDLRTLASDEETESFRRITPDGRVIYTLNQGIFLDDVFIVNPDGTGGLNLTNRQDEDVVLGFLP